MVNSDIKSKACWFGIGATTTGLASLLAWSIYGKHYNLPPRPVWKDCTMYMDFHPLFLAGAAPPACYTAQRRPSLIVDTFTKQFVISYYIFKTSKFARGSLERLKAIINHSGVEEKAIEISLPKQCICTVNDPVARFSVEYQGKELMGIKAIFRAHLPPFYIRFVGFNDFIQEESNILEEFRKHNDWRNGLWIHLYPCVSVILLDHLPNLLYTPMENSIKYRADLFPIDLQIGCWAPSHESIKASFIETKVTTELISKFKNIESTETDEKGIKVAKMRAISTIATITEGAEKTVLKGKDKKKEKESKYNTKDKESKDNKKDKELKEEEKEANIEENTEKAATKQVEIKQKNKSSTVGKTNLEDVEAAAQYIIIVKSVEQPKDGFYRLPYSDKELD